MMAVPSPSKKHQHGVWGEHASAQPSRRRCLSSLRFGAVNPSCDLADDLDLDLCAASLTSGFPRELLDKVMDFCTAKELAALEATCKHFTTSGVVQKYAQTRLQASGRAQNCLQPAQGENWISLLEFVERQTLAHAQATAIALGGHHTAALVCSTTNSKGFSLATFGRGVQGQLGDGAYTFARLAPQSILGNNETDSVEPWIADETDAEARNHVANNVPTQEEMKSYLANAYPAVLNAGSDHTLMIARSGAVYSWGLSRNGALGLNSFATTEASPKRMPTRDRIVSVSAGASHSLVLTENGGILGCGSNFCGQIGPLVGNSVPALVEIPLGHDIYRPVASIAAGQNHSVALTDTGQVWTWGSGNQGQLGHELIANCVKDSPGMPFGSKQPRPVLQLDPASCALQDRVTCISASGDQTALVSVRGRLIVFGSNKLGCLGTGDTEPVMTPLEIDLHGVTSKDSSSYRVIQACCGKNHMVILLRCQGKILVCTSGSNQFGQLGLGHFESKCKFTIVESLSDMRIVAIAAGHDHSAAVSASGQLFMWGCNESGQLGLGTDEQTAMPTLVPSVRVATPQKTLNRLIN